MSKVSKKHLAKEVAELRSEIQGLKIKTTNTLRSLELTDETLEEVVGYLNQHSNFPQHPFRGNQND